MEAVVKKATQKTSLEKQIQSSAAANPDINTNSFTKCKRPVVQDDFLCVQNAFWPSQLLPLQILNIEANMDNDDDEIHDIFIFWHQ